MTIIEDKENLLDEIRNEIKKIKEHLKIPDLKYYEFETNYFIWLKFEGHRKINKF